MKHAAFATRTLELRKAPPHVLRALFQRLSRGIQPIRYRNKRVTTARVRPLCGGELIAGSNAITHQRGVNEGYRSKKTGSPMELIILARACERRVETASFHDSDTANEHCRGMDKIAIQHIAEDISNPDRGIADRLCTTLHEGA